MSTTATTTADHTEWLSKIEEVGEDAGYFQTLGKRHWAFFSDESTTLLVTFESAEAIRNGSEAQLPAGLAIAKARGWSHLCVIAEGETFYRDRAVYGYFDRLVDDAFFEDFDRVVFYGAGMGGYAACAYSVTAPGATVIAVQPMATLDPTLAEWDKRHLSRRRLNFTDRYGYAPDMIEGAGDVYVIYDPEETFDAVHAALFDHTFVRRLRCRNLGGQIEQALMQMQILPKLIEAGCEGRLRPALFHRLYRDRRDFGPYLRLLLSRLTAKKRPLLEAMLCRSVLARMSAPRFRRHLTELEPQLEALGVKLPGIPA